MNARNASPRTLTLALALLASACAGGGAARRPEHTPEVKSEPVPAGGAAAATASPSAGVGTAGPGAAGAAAGPAASKPGSARELSPRAQRLFEEAAAGAGTAPADWEAAERRWRAVLDVEEVPEAWFNVGVALQHRGQTAEARAAYQKALAREPGLAPAAVNLALLDEPKDPRAPAEAWAALARRFPDDPVPRARLATLYADSGQGDEAWRLAREALVRDPRSVDAYRVLVRVALERGSTDLAMLLLVKARKLDERDPGLLSSMGDVAWRQKDEPGAVGFWTKALALDSGHLPARYSLLGHALSRERWPAVLEQAEAILKAVPDDARVLLALGVALRHQGELDKALLAYERAEKAGGARLPEVHLARGVLLMKSKDQCEPALAELQRYVQVAGPAVAAEGPAGKLIRECTQTVAAKKDAAEASKQLQAEGERKGQGTDAGGAASQAHGTPAEGEKAPVEAPPGPPKTALVGAETQPVVSSAPGPTE